MKVFARNSSFSNEIGNLKFKKKVSLRGFEPVEKMIGDYYRETSLLQPLEMLNILWKLLKKSIPKQKQEFLEELSKKSPEHRKFKLTKKKKTCKNEAKNTPLKRLLSNVDYKILSLKKFSFVKTKRKGLSPQKFAETAYKLTRGSEAQPDIIYQLYSFAEKLKLSHHSEALLDVLVTALHKNPDNISLLSGFPLKCKIEDERYIKIRNKVFTNFIYNFEKYNHFETIDFLNRTLLPEIAMPLDFIKILSRTILNSKVIENWKNFEDFYTPSVSRDNLGVILYETKDNYILMHRNIVFGFEKNKQTFINNMHQKGFLRLNKEEAKQVKKNNIEDVYTYLGEKRVKRLLKKYFYKLPKYIKENFSEYTPQKLVEEYEKYFPEK